MEFPPSAGKEKSSVSRANEHPVSLEHEELRGKRGEMAEEGEEAGKSVDCLRND